MARSKNIDDAKAALQARLRGLFRADAGTSVQVYYWRDDALRIAEISVSKDLHGFCFMQSDSTDVILRAERWLAERVDGGDAQEMRREDDMLRFAVTEAGALRHGLDVQIRALDGWIAERAKTDPANLADLRAAKRLLRRVQTRLAKKRA